MPAYKSRRFYAPKFMAGDGRAIVEQDTVDVNVALLVNDTLEFHIPAGLEVASLELDMTDMDTNASPTLAFSVGFAPMDPEPQVVANPTYFAPVGQATARTGGRLICSFLPIKFDEDVMLRVTIGTAAATFAAGRVTAIMFGAGRGIK